MIAATAPVQRPPHARLLVVDRAGRLSHRQRRDVIEVFRAGDLVVANDAATIPASLNGRHVPSGRSLEIRLAGRESLDVSAVNEFVAVVFGLGDFRMRTEDRPAPPVLRVSDRLALGPLTATVAAHELEHPRLIRLAFDGSPREIWEGIARHGRVVQYSHIQQPLALWDTWTPIAGPPVAFEPPSAGFVLDWRTLAGMKQRGVEFATLTHAAGLSSTGDDALDAWLPFDEPYRIPYRTAAAVTRARFEGRRIVAVGTTVVRALEHAASRDGVVHAGDGLARGRIGASTELRVVDAILSGTHEPGSSHFELLRAFAHRDTLGALQRALDANGYLTHEFGDSILIERAAPVAMPVEHSIGRAKVSSRQPGAGKTLESTR
jgi:S-adenosylmethionine:tRNA ribosyltransferase-isomerase